MKPLKRPSFSTFDTFSWCERQAFLRCLVPMKPTAALERGKKVHKWLESCLNGEGDVCGEFYDIYQNLEKAGVLDALQPKEVEVRSRELSWRGSTLPWSAVIDLVSGTTPVPDSSGQKVVASEPQACVIDWKTISNSRRIKSPQQARRSLQLRSYCILKDVRDAGFIYILPSGKIHMTMVQFEDRDLDQAFEWIRQTSDIWGERWGALGTRKEEEIDQFGGWDVVFSMAPPDHPLCSKQWCQFYRTCFEGKDLYSDDSKGNSK